MPLDESSFCLAKKMDPAAIESLLAAMCPAVHRMAHGLTGRADVGDGIVRFLVKQAIHRLPTWRDSDAAERWFHHHTVLTCRRASQHQPTLKDEVLIPADSDAQYVAFIRAVRGLPQQQREAFILHYAERLTPRTLAIAMDCSTHAADQHLKGAQAVLEPLAGLAFNAMKDRMAQAYQRLAPTEQVLRPALRRQIKRSLFPRRVKRLVKLVVFLTLLAALLWSAYHFGYVQRLVPTNRR